MRISDWSSDVCSSDLDAPVPVDLELVLAVDVSGSIDPEEARLQREGYFAALTDSDVIAAIRSGLLQRIAATFVEWAGAGYQRRSEERRVGQGGVSTWRSRCEPRQ